jgi:hypothetical protein
MVCPDSGQVPQEPGKRGSQEEEDGRACKKAICPPSTPTGHPPFTRIQKGNPDCSREQH